METPTKSGEALTQPHPEKDFKNTGTKPIKYIYEAELLLAYVAQNGLEIDDAIVTVIVNSKYWLEQGEWNPEREIQFWIAFNTLAKRVSPVSVASLKATSSTAAESSILREQHRGFNFYWLPKGSTFAKQSVILYQKTTVWVLLVLLLTHSYWLSESMRIAPVLELPQQIKEVNEQLNLAKRNLATPEQEVDDPRISELKTKLQYYNGVLQAHQKMLGTSLLGVFLACSEKFTERKSDQDKKSLEPEQTSLETLLQSKKLILTILQLFVLPLLYGLLGAFVYVLRTLTIEIKTLTYTKESNISYRLRIQLGALAGLAIGWFTGPNASFSLDSLSSEALSTFSTGGLSAQTLSPMALAFVAGYSVDVLFALMDRIIYAFSTKESTSLSTFKPSLTTNKAATDK